MTQHYFFIQQILYQMKTFFYEWEQCVKVNARLNGIRHTHWCPKRAVYTPDVVSESLLSHLSATCTVNTSFVFIFIKPKPCVTKYHALYIPGVKQKHLSFSWASSLSAEGCHREAVKHCTVGADCIIFLLECISTHLMLMKA